MSVSEREIDQTCFAPQSRPGIAVSRLMMTNFRSYAALDLNVGASSIVLTGINGAGKTNILEALSMLSPGRGLRGATLAQVSRRAAGEIEDGPGAPWAVSGTIDTANGPVQLGAGYMPGQDTLGTKRAVRIDGEPAGSAAALTEYLQIVWLTPAQDRLFLDGASDRRRFLDRLIASFEARHAGLWASYEKAMRERLALLRAGRMDTNWLKSVERIMAENAVALAAGRREGIARLSAVMVDGEHGSAFPSADIAIDGEVEILLDQHPAIVAEDLYANILAQSRDNDAEAGRTRHGPHLTDLVLRHRAKGRDARHCSTGEQKSLMIRLVLAGAELGAQRNGNAPVLLLDEIVAHLDEFRRRALFDAISQLGAQAWLTGTDERPFEALGARARLFHVSNGSVLAASMSI